MLLKSFAAILIFSGTCLGQQTAPEKPLCLAPHNEPGYFSWFCDEGGNYAGRETVYFIRENRFGARTATLLWSGTIDNDTKQRVDTTIADHVQSAALCQAFFHIGRSTSDGQPQWNRVTKNMQKWWAKNGKKKFPGLCYSSDPWSADYVILWGDEVERIGYTYSVPVTERSSVSGTTTGWVGGQYVSGNYSGTVNTTRMETHQGTRSEWNVLLAVRPVRGSSSIADTHLGTPVFWSDHTGRWRWSKPDKDSLIDALKYISQDLAERLAYSEGTDIGLARSDNGSRDQ